MDILIKVSGTVLESRSTNVASKLQSKHLIHYMNFTVINRMHSSFRSCPICKNSTTYPEAKLQCLHHLTSPSLEADQFL